MERTARDAAVRPATRLVILVAFVFGVAMAQPAPPDGPPGAVAPLSVPLVACDGGEHACVKLKPETSDIVGLWRAYFHHPVLQPVDGLSYVRFHPDGRYNLSATAEQSVDAAAPWPSGTFTLEDGVLTFETDAAGALCDGATIARASALGLDPWRRLQDNDSYSFFAALGDLLLTGPTHTNVIFDAAVPPGYPLGDDAVRREIDRAVGELEGKYFAIVTIDKPYEGAS